MAIVEDPEATAVEVVVLYLLFGLVDVVLWLGQLIAAEVVLRVILPERETDPAELRFAFGAAHVVAAAVLVDDHLALGVGTLGAGGHNELSGQVVQLVLGVPLHSLLAAAGRVLLLLAVPAVEEPAAALSLLSLLQVGLRVVH